MNFNNNPIHKNNINHYNNSTYYTSDNKNNNLIYNECPICFNELKKEEITYKPMYNCLFNLLFNSNNNLCVLNCNHTFHRKCIIKWFNIDKTCPICRNKIKKIK